MSLAGQAAGVLLALGCALSAPRGGDLTTRIEELARRDAAHAEWLELADEAFEQAATEGARSNFWNTLGSVAQLCHLAPPATAREVRARALWVLARNDSDTRRWSALVLKSFLPELSRIPRAQWRAELDAYDRALADAALGLDGERVLIELASARAFARVHINRRWAWLSEADRAGALALFDQLDAAHGEALLPGTRTDTVGARVSAYRFELMTLHFGAVAPATAGIDLEAAPLDLKDLRGQVVVIDFWTTFCQPCLALVPGVRDLLGELSGQPVVYLGVCGDHEREVGLATARRVGMTWRNLWDGPTGPEGPLANAWNVPAIGWPSVFVLDVEGCIRFKLRGKEQVEAELAGAIQLLLGEAQDL